MDLAGLFKPSEDQAFQTEVIDLTAVRQITPNRTRELGQTAGPFPSNLR